MKFEENLVCYNQFVNSCFSEESVNRSKERAKVFLIDENNLSDEVASQPAMYSYIANLLAHAKKERNKTKLDLKVVEANIKRSLAEERDSSGKKLTVDAIGAIALTHQDHLTAQARWIEAEELVDHMEADQEASKQKGQMLSLLASTIKREQMLKGAI